MPAQLPAEARFREMVFIVQGKPRSPDGILKVIKDTRQEAMQAANDLLENGMAFVTIIADGLVYTVEEFSFTFWPRTADLRSTTALCTPRVPNLFAKDRLPAFIYKRIAGGPASPHPEPICEKVLKFTFGHLYRNR